MKPTLMIEKAEEFADKASRDFENSIRARGEKHIAEQFKEEAEFYAKLANTYTEIARVSNQIKQQS
jgi:type IV secretory pathway VirB4 component